MLIGIRESKARLSELLSKAGAGEEVVITVRGRPAARLVPIRQDDEGAPSTTSWAKELRTRLKGAAPARASSSREILDDLRGDR